MDRIPLSSLNEIRVQAGLPPFVLARFAVPIANLEVRDSGAGDGQFTIRGHASVFDRQSCDLGGFTESIAPGAFTRALNGAPDVHMLWDHDTSKVLARTKNGTLELREDPMGLHMWGRVAPTSYSGDLRVLMARGDIDQASFAFTIEREEWTENEDDGSLHARVLEVRDLYDVTVCAQGAYPAASAQIARARLQNAYDLGRLSARDHQHSGDPAPADPVEVVDEAPPPGDASTRRDLAVLRSRSRRYT